MATRPALSLARLCPHAARHSAPALAPLVAPEVPPPPQSLTRSYAQIPQPKGVPIFGTLFGALRNGVITRLHEYIDMRYRQLGPIYREKLGNIDAVFLFDPKDVQTVFQNEGKHPRHIIPDAWKLHKEITQKPRGLFFMDGEHWLSRRRVINQLLLLPKVVPQYSDRINETVDDLISRWMIIKGQTNVVDKVEVEMFNWSIECIGTVLFDERLGCLSLNRPPEIQEFVRSIQEIFRTTMILTMIPPRIAKFLRLPVWNKFLRSMNTSMVIARKYIHMSMEKVMAKMERGEPVNDFCSSILAREEFDADEIVRLTTDLFSGAADTVSNAMAWALYLISQRPDVQEKIHEEVTRIVPDNVKSITPDMLKKMNYVKAVMKETLRLYPVVAFHSRYLDRDLTIKGYNIPADTLIMMVTYSMGRDEKNFDRPNDFVPERWFRGRESVEDREAAINSHYATIPFAFGPRCCVGRRLAELEMHVMLAKLVRKFKIEYASDTPVDIDLRLVTAPKQSIKIRLLDRDAAPMASAVSASESCLTLATV